MRIREGEPLEIYTETDGSVIFKKYSPLGEMGSFTGHLAEAVTKTCGRPCIICDRDAVIAAGGSVRERLDGKLIDPELEAVLENRQLYKDHNAPVAASPSAPDVFLCPIMPVIAGGDLCGCIALVSDEKLADEGDIRAIQTAAMFFARQLED